MQEIDFEIKKEHLYESVAEKLEIMIISDSGQLGQKLPSEQSLAKSFGVSRNIIREALKILKERGLIDLRTGEGAYITKPASQTLTDLIGRMLVMDNIDAASVYEMRVLFEIKACSLAAERATEQEFQELENINQQMKEQSENIDARVELDLLFHAHIAKITKNPLLGLFVQSMTSLLKTMIKQAIQFPGGSENGIEYHQKIIDCLRSRDLQRAEDVMREHLNESMRQHDIYKKS